MSTHQPFIVKYLCPPIDSQGGGYRCSNGDLPIGENNPRDLCPWLFRNDSSVDSGQTSILPDEEDPRTKQCLHAVCRQPIITKETVWLRETDMNAMSVASYRENSNVTLLAMVNGSSGSTMMIKGKVRNFACL